MSDGDIGFRRVDSGNNSSYSEEEMPRVLKRVNNHILVKEFGAGSFARVFLALDDKTDSYKAIKVFKLKDLQKIPSGISQLKRELSAMRKLQHMNILALKDVMFDPEKSVVYAVLEYADCGSLAVHEGLPLSAIRTIFYQVLQSLEYLHGRKMVHQDIKPSNILLCSDGRVLLSDFGVGHSFQSTDMVVGSPAFQAPELLGDENTDDPTKEDIWSLGVSLYVTAFGRLPFVGDTVYEIIRGILDSKLTIPEDADAELAAVITAMLDVDPHTRISVADAMEMPFFVHCEPMDFSELILPVPSRSSSTEIVDVKVIRCDDESLDFIPPDMTKPVVLRSLNA